MLGLRAAVLTYPEVERARDAWLLEGANREVRHWRRGGGPNAGEHAVTLSEGLGGRRLVRAYAVTYSDALEQALRVWKERGYR